MAAAAITRGFAATQHQGLPSMSRHRPKGSPLPKAPFAAGVAVMGGMFYTVTHDAKRQPGTLDTQTAQKGGATTLSVDADTSSSVPSSSVPAKAQPKTAAQFLGGYEEVCQPPRRRGAHAASPPRGAHTVARWPPIPGGVHAVYMQHRARCTAGCTCTPRVHCTRRAPCQVSAANVPPYVLASTNLDNEQKLQAR